MEFWSSNIIRILLSVSFGLAMAACGRGKSASSNPDGEVRTKFDTTIADIDLNLKESLPALAPKGRTQEDRLIESAEYLQLANDMIEISDGLDDQRSQKVRASGFEALKQFYDRPELTYAVTVESNPYIPTAYSYAKNDILTLTDTQIRGGLERVNQYLTSHPFVYNKQESANPGKLVGEMKNYLSGLPEAFLKESVSKTMVEEIRKTISEKYLGLLENLEKALTGQTTESDAGELLTTMESALAGIPDTLLAKRERVEVGKKISRAKGWVQRSKLATEDDASQLLSALLEIYEDESFRSKLPQELTKFFESLSPETRRELILRPEKMGMAAPFIDGFWTALKLGGTKWAFTHKIEKFGLKKAQKLLNDAVSGSALEMFEGKIAPMAGSLSSTVYAKISESSLAKLEFLLKNMDSVYENEARKVLKKEIFGEKDRLVVFERKYVNLATRPLTSANAIVEGLRANYNQINQLEREEERPESSVPLRSSIFRIVARLLAVAGYDDVYGKWSESLHVRIGGSDPSQTLLNIKAYHPEEALFAIPDDMPLKNNWFLDRNDVKDPVFSARNQMKLLQIFSQGIRFFRKWEPNIFDRSLGLVAPEQYPGIEVFPKKSFYKLNVGLSAIILKNLVQKNVAVIDSEGVVHRAGDENLMNVPRRQSAVIVDFDRKGMRDTIMAADAAAAIEGLVDVLEATQDFEKVSDVDDGLAENIPALQEARPKLQLVILGLANFVTTKLQSADGLFAREYSLVSKVASADPRKLEDQMLLIRALLKAGRYLNAPIFISSALDGFFGIKRKLFDESLGFFRDSESKASSNMVRLKNVTGFFKLAQSLKGALVGRPESLHRLNAMESFFAERFLSDGILETSPTQKLSIFSP